MKLSRSCRGCLKRLAIQAAALATDDENIRITAVNESLRILDTYFSLDEVSIVVASKMHDIIKLITKNTDPYRRMKDIEISAGKALFAEVGNRHNHGFVGLLKIAALGNAIDFFRPIEVVKQEMKKEIEFAIDMSASLEIKLRNTDDVLYLADNAGEVYFDLPLVKWMRQFADVTYVVKSKPVQNDVTLYDVQLSGLEAEFGDLLTTGSATPGIDFKQASEEFKQRYASAGLIFAKGMGYYESLSELPLDGRVFYCLKAKCLPVADSLNVPMHSFAAFFL